MLQAQQIKVIQDYGDADLGIAAIYLFGSEAEGRARAGSDVDLAVVLHHPVDGFRRIQMETELSTAIGRDVHLVVFHEASPLLKGQILKARKLVYEGDREERVRQETFGRYEYWDTRSLHREVETTNHG